MLTLEYFRPDRNSRWWFERNRVLSPICHEGLCKQWQIPDSATTVWLSATTSPQAECIGPIRPCKLDDLPGVVVETCCEPYYYYHQRVVLCWRSHTLANWAFQRINRPFYVKCQYA